MGGEDLEMRTRGDANSARRPTATRKRSLCNFAIARRVCVPSLRRHRLRRCREPWARESPTHCWTRDFRGWLHQGRGCNYPIIGVNSLHLANRQRFTLAHEIAELTHAGATPAAVRSEKKRAALIFRHLGHDGCALIFHLRSIQARTLLR
jgi:hypothetical protein